ncbi:hypothetical protein [Xenorhabdus hominickii]
MKPVFIIPCFVYLSQSTAYTLI